MNTFERDGIRFHYPDGWPVEAEDAEDGGWTATVQSPDVAFFMVSLQPEADTPAELADQTLAALKSDYQELDAENVVESVAGRVAIGHDLDILTLDTTIMCRTRCLDTPAGPLLVMTQFTEYERSRHEIILRAIRDSLEIDEE